MSCVKRTSDLMKILNGFSRSELSELADTLSAKLAAMSNDLDDSVYNLFSDEIKACKHCGSISIVKNGKDRHGHTRYICKDCRKTFGKVSDSVVFRTQKNASVWKKYIALMLDGKSIIYCAQECGISKQTSFDWRHKILSALSQESFPEKFGGLIEMDELFMRISYKGNHKNKDKFVMPREAFKRGSDNRIPGNASKACVLCVVERNKAYSAKITCRGLLTSDLLSKTLDNRIENDSIVMTDGEHQYGLYFKDKYNIEHVVLKAHSNKKPPEIKGAFHINNVNALHKRFRDFIYKYNGVSTKYLGNYVSLFLWLENNKSEDIAVRTNTQIQKMGTYLTATAIHSLAPAPNLADDVAA
ncbi:MAG: IS1595 family transposase [Clostridia bacterium]|nr:IS1595 family transposase [Clostridia bacterium]